MWIIILLLINLKSIIVSTKKEAIIDDYIMASKKGNLIYGAAMNLCW